MLNEPGAQPMVEVGEYYVYKVIRPGESKSRYFAIHATKNGVTNNNGEFGILHNAYELDPKLGNNQQLKGKSPFVAKVPRSMNSDQLTIAHNESEVTQKLIKNALTVMNDDIPFLIMPRFDGEEIYDARKVLAYCKPQKRKQINFVNRLLVATQLFEQMCDCHFPENEKQNPIIHKDIKPENILIATHLLKQTFEEAREDYLKGIKKNLGLIIDFGLAQEVTKDAQKDPRKNTTPITRQGEPKTGHSQSGSMTYVSPELVLKRELSLNSDMYSLAAVMLTLFGSVTMPEPKTEIDHENEKLKAQEKQLFKNILQKTKAFSQHGKYHSDLPEAIILINAYCKLSGTEILSQEDPLYFSLLKKHMSKVAPELKPEDIKQFCKLVNLGRFRFSTSATIDEQAQNLHKSVTTALSKIHSNWISANRGENSFKIINAGFGDEGIFEDIDVPSSFTETHPELLASLPDEESRKKYHGTILGIFHFMINRMQDNNMRKRPSSRQMLYFCQTMLAICFETSNKKDKIDTLNRILSDVTNCRETKIEELKKPTPHPSLLLLPRATSETGSPVSPLGSYGGFTRP